MIVEFSVKNFRSIKELQTLSFSATKLDSNQEKYPDIDRNNIVIEDGIRLLKTVGIYGANASGKSNIVRALEYFYTAVSDLPSPVSRLSALVDPFLFQENSTESESFFQIVLIFEAKKYRYGFTVKKNNNIIDDKDSKDIITSEWLYGPKEKNQVKYFIRKGLEIEKENLSTEKVIPNLDYKHTLYLTHASSYDKDSICASIRGFISGYMISNFVQGLDFFRFHTMRMLEEKNRKKELLDFLSSFQLKYSDIIVEKDEEASKQTRFPQNKIFLSKDFKTANGQSIRLNLKNSESEGTKKLFDLAGLLITAFKIPIGGIIILDELDSNFHPSLIIKLIEMFNNPAINKAGVQLLFTSHDTNLLSPSIMRRDQFYFAEKDENDATRLYSLADLKGIRNDADFARQYLAGFYGAVPLLSDYIDKISE